MALLKKKSLNKMFDMGDVVSVIGPEAYFQGTLSVKGSLRIDGKLEGAITESSAVIVGDTGKIIGDITGESIIVGGEVCGNICATQFAELLSTSTVSGDIRTKKILIEEGAFFDGHCNMIKHGDESESLMEEDTDAEGL